MPVFSKLFPCCGSSSGDTSSPYKKHLAAESGDYAAYKDHPAEDEKQVANRIVTKLLTAEKNDAILKADLQSTIHSYGWYDGLAAAILAGVEDAIKLGKEMAPAMKSAYDKAVDAINKVEQWAGEHPVMAEVIVTLIALGILAIMMPWLMAWLGFAEEGIIAGSWAARWQALFRGFVPKRSLFSMLQSLGTKIGRSWTG